jgi:HEXXH motif-containing protein
MEDLRARVRNEIGDGSTPLWWPGLATALVRDRASRLDFPLQEYTTSRFLERALAPRKFLRNCSGGSASHLALTLEVMPLSLHERFADRGLEFAKEDEVTSETAAVVCAATRLICPEPSLAQTVRALVRSVHILKSKSAGFDVSFSDPKIPFSVFLSVPSGAHADLRIAEALVHECMHLQLTLVEEVLPLVKRGQASSYSPWKQANRPISGVMHALYVFRVIDSWLASLAGLRSQSAVIERRRAQIAEEVSELELSGKEPGFTSDGAQLIQRLLLASGSSAPTL